MEKVDEIDEVENLVVGFLGIRRPGHVTGRTQVPALVYSFFLSFGLFNCPERYPLIHPQPVGMSLVSGVLGLRVWDESWHHLTSACLLRFDAAFS